MKKNLWFKLGLFCTALVLVATCFITSAWAKYTKTVSATDSARVAKFAVKVTEDQTEITSNTKIDIFTTQLDNIYKDTTTNNNVNTEKLIAPGSNGSFKIKVENTSEVAITLALTAKISYTNLPEGVKAVPVKFYIGTTAPKNDADYKDLADLTFAAQELTATDGTTATTTTYTVFWKWVESDNDTKLGEAAVAILLLQLT